MNMKRVLVYGSGKSGIAACDLLCGAGSNVLIFDENKNASKEDILSRVKRPDMTECIFGTISGKDLEDIDEAVISPGISLEKPAVTTLREHGVKIIGELELAYRNAKGRLFAITGTNGKTTTTALLGQMVKDYYGDGFVVGNIGIPYTTIAADTKDDSVTVAEVSSFQLETVDTFRADVSAILNITEDHLDRHHTMEEYIRVKELITNNQTKENFCVLNYNDPVLRDFGESIKDRVGVIFFSAYERIPGGVYLEGNTIVSEINGKESIIDVRDMKIIGLHNYENAMAACAMGEAGGIPAESLAGTLGRFTAVPHRIEFVEEVSGVVYYNDSKATNPDAAIKGIEAMSRPTFLIGGGYDKGSDYGPWIEAFGGRVKKLVLEGKTAEDIRKAALGLGFSEDKIVMKADMKEAFDYCAQNAENGDAVLLSPACASWGEFDNYEQRGEIFKEYVRDL